MFARTFRSLPLRGLLVVPVLALGVTACTGGPGSEEDLANSLQLDDSITEDQAECIAAAVFDVYEDDEDALSRISAAASYEDLTGEDGIEGFNETFEQIVQRAVASPPACTAPTD